MSDTTSQPTIKSTTVIAVSYKDQVAIGADGQATIHNTVAKNHVKKIHKLLDGKVVIGFAGATADAFTLRDLFSEKLNNYPANMKRAAIEVAKEWRTKSYLRKLEAMIIAVNKESILIISGSGDVIEPDMQIAAIGSGGTYAQAAAMALIGTYPFCQEGQRKEKETTEEHSIRIAKEIVQKSLEIAGELCIYTNKNITIETPV